MKTGDFTLLPITLLVIDSAQVAGLPGRDIMQRVESQPGGDTRYANVEMILIQRNGHKRTRRLGSWAMGIGKDTKKVMFFIYPGDVKGTGFLTQDYDNPREMGDKWLYLPAMKKTRCISDESSRTDYFVGNDFTYNDMSMRSVDEEKHQLLREENLDGRRYWAVQSIPNDKDEICTRRVIWVRRDCLMAVKTEYYDKLNRLHRRLSISNIGKVQGFWTVRLMQMENVQAGHKTIIRMGNQRLNIRAVPNLFTVSKLEKRL